MAYLLLPLGYPEAIPKLTWPRKNSYFISILKLLHHPHPWSSPSLDVGLPEFQFLRSEGSFTFFLFSHLPSVSPISSTSTHLSNQNISHHLHSHNPSLRHLQSKQLQCFLIGLHVSTFDTVSISSSRRAASRISLKHITRFLKMLQYCP